MMAYAEKNWFAGIFDGEGSLVVALTKRRLGGFHLTVQASLVNTDPAIIEEVVRISTKEGLAPFVVWRQPPQKYPHWKIKGEVWWYGQKRVLRLCYLIGAFLRSEKKQKVAKLIEFLEDRIASSYHARTNIELLRSVLPGNNKQEHRLLEIQKRGGKLIA